MKEIHLLCNAHLDPVWLWQRQEGIAEAISTFRVAADFCEKYDGFVFNHNESVLYEWVEENEPELFERIKKLVKDGKWHIMGGWYLQPDCLMPSGETFIRQLETGHDYFMDKFGVETKTAVNLDPFGHARGLVQILSKCGYNSYLFMRPYDFVPEHDFVWKGYDGSEIFGHCIIPGYNTNKGKAIQKLEAVVKDAHDGANLMLWGIGNHGGGPSEVDLNALNDYAKNHPEVKIIHSWCENYFDTLDKSKLRTIDTSLVHCMVGCYTSMVRIKQMHRLMENELSICEKMLASSNVKYDKKELADAQKALLFCEFHDVLPGSMIKKAEDDALRLMNYGREIISRYTAKAFFALCSGQKKGKRGEIPVLVYNPSPYKIYRDIEVEFQLEDQNWNDNECTIIKVRDEDGNYLPAQNEKEASSVRLDWRKRVVFRAELKPMSVNRFDCELEVIKSFVRPIEPCSENDTHFICQNDEMTVMINKSTGLIDKFTVDGIDYLKSGSGKIIAYRDNEDPWGMTVDGFCDRADEFKAVSAEEANSFNGYPNEKLANVRVIENGAVRCKIQAIFKCENSFAVVTYTIPKKGRYVDIKIKTLTNDADRMYKLSFDTCFENPEFIGQSVFGRETLLKDEKEVTFHKWCGLFKAGKGLAIINNCSYAGSSFGSTLNISLLRTAIYSAHPILDRPITDPDRNHDRIDMGEREFEYRLTADINTLDKDSDTFNQPPYAISFFPSGNGERPETSVEIKNDNIIMSRFKKDDALMLRLYNSSELAQSCEIEILGKNFETEFAPFEIKTFIMNSGGLKETNILCKEK